MTIQLGVVMDPIESITVKKDTTFAMLLAAQARGFKIHYFEQPDLYLRKDQARGRARVINVKDDPRDWFSIQSERDMPLVELDVLLMRKDPPFDMEYIYTTYLLENAAAAGTLVINRPQSLRDANEKLFTASFPQCCAPAVATRQGSRIRQFLEEQRDIIVKPLDGMGGAGVFRLRLDDPNISVVLETLTGHGQRMVIAQQFLPEIVAGDKRILLVDGEPVPYALARIPAQGETRANLAAGGRGVGVALTERDYWICQEVAPKLRQMGLIFVGLDVIGDYLTEINVTSPTCVRELDGQFGLNIGAQLMDAIERHLR
jgi:glutathione synthase